MGRSLACVALGVALCVPVVFGQPQTPAVATPGPGLDLVLVLDNSGSMKRNDPQFLTRTVVSGFLTSNRLPNNTRLGVVVFAENADLVLPLSPVADPATRQRLSDSLKQLDYTGRLTDTAAAVERASYELRQQGRPGTSKVIVLLTDGLIDTGDRARDVERGRWLTTDLSDACVRVGTRIFGVAFTERADFQLIQSLGEKTGGDYYRILRTEDVPGAFERIAASLAAPAAQMPASALPRPAVSPSVAVPVGQPATGAAPAPGTSSPGAALPMWQSLWLMIGPGLGLLALVAAVAALALLWRSKQQRLAEEALLPEGDRPYLLDLTEPPVLAEPTYELTQRITRIGRMKGGAGVLHVDEHTVSAQHAEIRYEDGTFFLVDTASANKTWLDDGPPLTPYVETPLKGGRIISIANCRFEFVMPGADTERTQMWIVDPTSEYGVRPARPGWQGSPKRPAPKDTPAAPLTLPTVSVLSSRDERLTVCTIHPESKATEICSRCSKEYCPACMRDRDGARVCVVCLDETAG